jgi:glycosyltransferase involved in cell wall biosynthesis
MSVVRAFLTENPDSKCIQTIHGIVPVEETPVRDERVKLVAVSQEIAEHHGIDTVITNGVDLDTFKPIRKLPKKPDSLLSLAQSEPFNAMLRQICRRRGIAFNSHNKLVNPVDDIHEHMRVHSIVVGIGRSAIEAAACGCMVILADHRPYQPAWTDGIMGVSRDIARDHNYSGRAHKWDADEDNMDCYIDCYRPEYGDMARSIAVLHHDISKKAREYMDVWNAFVGGALR